MSDQSPTFVLADSYSYLNKGDAGIILGMLKGLREEFDGPEVTIISETPDIDSRRYPGPVATRSSPFRNVYRADSLFEKAFRFQFAITIMLYAALFRATGGRVPCPGELSLIRTYDDADAVLIAGGDKFYDYDEGLKAAVQGLPKLLETMLAIVLGNRLIIYAHSGGPFNNAYRRTLLKWIFDYAAVITAREPISGEFFRSLGADVKLTADAAFAAPDGDEQGARRELELNGIDHSKPIAGMTVRDWYFPAGDGDMDQYRAGVSQTMEFLHSEGYQVVLFPQVIGINTDDRVLSRELASESDSAVALKDDYDVPMLRELIGQCDLFVGTRMHSNIFALSKGVPTVAVAYRHKTDGIMRTFGLEENVVDINDTAEELLDKVERLEGNRNETRNQIRDRLPKIRSEALRNAILVRKAIGSRR